MSSDQLDPKLEAARFLRDIENHLRSESLPEVRESLGGWILLSQRNAEATEAAEEDSRRLDELLHDKTRLIQAIRPEQQQQLDETLSQAAALRKECDRRLAKLSRRTELLERQKQAILRRITVKFYGYSSARLELLRPKDFACEEVRRQFVQQIGDRICPEMSPESRAATRAAEIVKLGKRQGIDDERVANWISGGISLDAISAEILDELASRSAQPATSGETEPPAPRTDGNHNGLYDPELAQVFRLGIAERVDWDRIADSIEKYWRPELTAAEFIAGLSGLERLKARAKKRSIIGEIFELFGEPDRAWEWKDAYVQRLLSELEQVAADATLESETSLALALVPGIEEPIGGAEVDDGFENFDEMMKFWEDASSAADLVAGDITAAAQELEPAETQNPPPDQPTPKSEPRIPGEIGTHTPDQKIEETATAATPDPPADPASKPAPAVKGRSLVSVKNLFVDLRSQFIVEIMVAYPKATYSEICAHADVRRQMRTDRNLVCPREKWIQEMGETRAPKDWMRDDDLWAKVFAHEKTHHKVEQWLSVRKKKLQDN